MRIEPTDAVIGARVSGVSLAVVPGVDLLEAIEDALERHGVLIFPDQDITPAEQVAFSRVFGPLDKPDLRRARLDGHDEIFVVGNTLERPVSFSPGTPDGELEWHTDHIHKQVPARASLLYARQVPSEGGDTLFACMYSAYDSLEAGQQAQYDKLQGINSAAGLRAYLQGQGYKTVAKERAGNPDEEVIWPLVRAHPRTGRKALYFGNQVTVGIVGWPAKDAHGFIAELTQHACQPCFQYRHRWQVGDAVLWDNRRLLHAGTTYDMARESRLMHRTTFRETAIIEMV